MKRILLILLPILVASCAKDKGNYTYHDINELAISGVNTGYSVLTNIDTLHIDPVIDMTQTSNDASRFDYIWIAKKGSTIIDTLGTDKVLSYPVTLAPDNYTLQLRVLDKETTVVWSKNTTLAVGTPYSRGIMLSGENTEGHAEVEMLSMVADTMLIKNILSESGLSTLQNAINVVHTGGNASYMKLWVFTGSGSYYLDRLTMKATEANRLSHLVYTTDPINTEQLDPAVLAPQIIDKSGNVSSTNVRAMLCQDGHIFTTYFLLNGGDFYANPVNRDKDHPETLLKAAPYLLYPLGNMSSMLWYDSQNQRFMNYSSFILNTASQTLADAPGDIFPWNQAASGRSLVYAENTRNTDGGSTNGNSFAILKDQSNQHFIYKFYANGSTPAKRDFYAIKPIATDFDKADFYAFSSNRTVVFYSVGAKLYAYDYNPGNEKIYSFPQIGTDEITMLKFDTQIDYQTNSLYIATYNVTNKGTLRRFMVGSNPNVVQLNPAENGEWDGLIKVTNMSWRAVN
ncbi:PKD-like family protein [bacterium A37T11]|nr:PKD-like family protein [bacterium A37T11]